MNLFEIFTIIVSVVSVAFFIAFILLLLALDNETSKWCKFVEMKLKENVKN